MPSAPAAASAAGAAAAAAADGADGGGGGGDRPLLAYFSAGNHGCVNVRQAIKGEMANASDCLPDSARKALGRAHKALRPLEAGGDAPRQALMHLATFCPCPEGDSPSAKRQYDALLAGCVPVLVSDDAMWGARGRAAAASRGRS